MAFRKSNSKEKTMNITEQIKNKYPEFIFNPISQYEDINITFNGETYYIHESCEKWDLSHAPNIMLSALIITKSNPEELLDFLLTFDYKD